ncbi:MAG: MurR/RpiR family transcriptional regulator [Acidobacteria bacterium]|nr:MAG: MurR/RpiR family transcriptional regulator [Acidobacteriota bacterium]REK01659.1 MAG: MurR/RpiR family transcriptional regulator [Acidobacteriota bacterium]REK14615.1 MAG: MurR/RpiR family transcriptional regulator [Acidobacteriota bacterium]REK45330.1 MAG: MurR/RpiR family transcriptional regulator [Acidobacteriota bacterium]
MGKRGGKKQNGKAPTLDLPVGDRKEQDASASQTTRLGGRFVRKKDSLSKSRRNLLRQILDDADETYFLSSREMSERYDVHAATIIRTVQALGYEKFADFAHDLREHFVMQITPYSSMRAAERTHLSVHDRILHSVDKDIENINKFRAALDPDLIGDIANRINEARSIVVIGIDFAASLANSLSYGLVRLGYTADCPTGSTGVLQNRLRIMTTDDLLIAISFGRGLRETVEAVKSAERRNIPTFGITNGDATPIAKHCDSYLVATIARTSFLDSYVAPVAAINAILVASAHSQSERALEHLKKSEEEYEASNRWYSGS